MAQVEVGQPTVSHHLAKLAEVGFVVVDHVANKALYRVNERCLAAFPSAAELAMGKLPAVDPTSCVPPWTSPRAAPSAPGITEADAT